MSAATCVACGGADVRLMRTAVGERAYCSACFHGWRTDPPAYAYSNTAMCSLGTSQARLDSQLRFFAPFAVDGATVLEIGCATGELAAAARTVLAIDRYDAIELSPAGERARSHVDQLYTVPLRELIARGDIARRYNLIVMSHVLEHILDPFAELAAMKQILAHDGAIFLEVPNGAGHRRLPFDDNRSHLHFFSATSLSHMLAGQGLEAVAAATDVRLDDRYADSLQVIARPFVVPAPSPNMLSDHPRLNGLTDIVVWGAGSLADELLANFFDPARIAFFVDGNPAKVGTQCLGKPVRSAGDIGDSPRVILVNSIDFAPAIEADIARMHPNVSHTVVRIGDLLN